MRKPILCCFATTTFLTFALSAQASPASVMGHAAGWASELVAGSVILVQQQSTTTDDAKKSEDVKKEDAPAKPKKAAPKKSMTKKDIDQKIKQYVPQEYQQYLQQGGGAGGIPGAGGQ